MLLDLALNKLNLAIGLPHGNPFFFPFFAADPSFTLHSRLINDRCESDFSERKPEMSTALPVLTTLCPICYNSPPKYRCPRCSMRTCSLECSQAHKLRASCSGVRDPSKFIPKREFKPATVDMDFNFLKRVEKTREEGHSAVKKVDKGASKTRKRKMSEAKKKRAINKAGKRGVNARELPAWMERAKENKVKWDSQ